MFRRLALFCLLAFSVLSPTLVEAFGGDNCVSSDSVAVLDERKGLFLVYRVSGLQDKVEFFEIYKGRPGFDVCGSARTPAIATQPYERSRGLLKRVEFRKGRLKLIYTHKASESIRLNRAKLSD